MFGYFLSIRVFCLGIGAIATLAAAGCGSSSSGSTTQVEVKSGSLSKAAFIKRSDEICKDNRQRYLREFEAKAELANEELSGANPKEQASLAAAAQASLVNTILAPNYERVIDQIDSLGAPSGDEKRIEAIILAIQRPIDELRAKPTKLAENLTPFERASELAKAYGLNGCAASLD
jgi:hypothetical protein